MKWIGFGLALLLGTALPVRADTCTGVATAYFPAHATFGVAMFEDLYPYDGDLDFNDQTVAFNYVLTLDANNQVVQLEGTYNLLAAGASLHNGLYLHFPGIAPAAASSISLQISGATSSTTALTANTGEHELVVTLAADTRALFTRPSDMFVNTDPGTTTQAAPVLKLLVTFAAGQGPAASAAPFDLYLARQSPYVTTKELQIHKPAFAGTDKMDTSVFGRGNDGSLSRSGGLHFIDANGLPFALEVPSQIEWMNESLEISEGYPGIIGFTGGASQSSWYTSPVSASAAVLFNGGKSGSTPPVPQFLGNDITSCAAPRSCAALLAVEPTLTNGAYSIDPDGNGTPVTLYCDMTNGGWTLVANQLAGTFLSSSTDDISASSFGSITASWRLGESHITGIAPATAWKMSDTSTTIYFKPSCVVDWTKSYVSGANNSPNVCTTAYTGVAFDSAVNGGWIAVATAGIGINNSGAYCSMRAYAVPGAVPTGGMFGCAGNGDNSHTVTLWYK